jgi:hypothetical protein
MPRGKVAELVAEAERRGWVIAMLEHDRAATVEHRLSDVHVGRLLITRTRGVCLEVHGNLGMAWQNMDEVPTVAAAATAMAGAVL